jgi:hypothetical protein
MKTTKRYNVMLAGCQSHIKSREYEDVSFEDVLYIIQHNTNKAFLDANGIDVPSIEWLGEYQDMSPEYSICIEECNPPVTCAFYGVDYPDYFTGFGYMRRGFCVPLFQQRYTGLELSRLIQEETDDFSYEFSDEQIRAINDMCAKFDTELKDEIVIDLPSEAITSEEGPNAYFIFNEQ